MSQTETTVLSESDVIDIRREAVMGTSVSSLAADYDVGNRYIYKILNGEKRASVPFPKTIKGFKNYEITSDGRVWSKNKNHYISTTAGKVRLTSISGVKKTLAVEKLISTHFQF